MKRRRREDESSSSKWGIFALAGVIAGVWVVVTLTLLPKGLENIRMELEHVGKPRAETPSAAEGGGRGGPAVQRPPAASLAEIVTAMRAFLDELHTTYATMPDGPTPLEVWRSYRAAADKWLLPLDRKSAGWGTFPVRTDDSIFVSVASYRDENCANTLEEIYTKAADPSKVFIGLVQQNCVEDCKSGVLEGGAIEAVEGDPDCYQDFCNSEAGKEYCSKVTNFFVNESESLGPAVARYFASKLWQGETFFMQIDAHMLFEEGWDTQYIRDMKSTPSYPKSVLSHYPPGTTVQSSHLPGWRICGGVFSETVIESRIVRLGSAKQWDSEMKDTPCPAAFVGAGFYFAHASFLAVAPYDPYVPWIFMGEEILLSLRLWTWGYDIYSPTRNMVSHIYVRRHKPKFWETVGRLFGKPGIHNKIQALVVERVKNVVGYPESASEVISPTSLLDHLDLYGEGPVRPLEQYLGLVGLDPMTKRSFVPQWCTSCQAPVLNSYPIPK